MLLDILVLWCRLSLCCSALIVKYHVASLDTHFSLDLSSHRLELFHDELEKWRTRPELIADLNQRQ